MASSIATKQRASPRLAEAATRLDPHCRSRAFDCVENPPTLFPRAGRAGSSSQPFQDSGQLQQVDGNLLLQHGMEIFRRLLGLDRHCDRLDRSRDGLGDRLDRRRRRNQLDRAGWPLGAKRRRDQLRQCGMHVWPLLSWRVHGIRLGDELRRRDLHRRCSTRARAWPTARPVRRSILPSRDV